MPPGQVSILVDLSRDVLEAGQRQVKIGPEVLGDGLGQTGGDHGGDTEGIFRQLAPLGLGLQDIVHEQKADLIA